MMMAAVATGAFVAAGQSLPAGATDGPTDDVVRLANVQGVRTALDSMGGTTPTPDFLPLSRTVDPGVEVAKLTRSERTRKEQQAKKEEAQRPRFVRPATGRFTSGYGGRWGQFHYGVDIANRIGTPIYAVTDGVVIEAGPARGFGLWVKIRHRDGTISVYGHVDRYLVREGQRVKAGQQIATMGNRGFSTGPHLHFEIWSPNGKKMNPLPWLNERGITL